MKLTVLGLFRYEDDCLNAAGKLKQAGFDDISLMSPIPMHGVEEVLGKKKKTIRYFSYFGAVIGAITGFALTVSTALTFVLPTGGRPIITFPPYLVITYEVTILFGIIATLIGFHVASGLPAWRDRAYTPEANVDRFVVAIGCAESNPEQAEQLFKELGADDVKRVENES